MSDEENKRDADAVATFPRHPSLQVLRGGNDALLEQVQLQLGIVRTLADELERCLAKCLDGRTVHEQLAHELARLGCQSLEIAAAITKRILVPALKIETTEWGRQLMSDRARSLQEEGSVK